jgi:peptidoglycan hydrolase-like protein with peptidoglycan-binding domain
MSAAPTNAQVTLSLPILRKGQHAGEPPVERLQLMLNFVKGVDDLDVDGIFGPKTEGAVRAFQW